MTDTEHSTPPVDTADDATASPAGPTSAPETDSSQGSSEDELRHRLFHLAMLLRRGGQRGGPGPHHHFLGQGRVLRLLTLHSPVAQRDLAYLLDVRPQSLGELLGKLEANGLITRTVDPDDARARLVELTDKGREVAEDLAEQPDIDPLAPLSENERTEFLAMLDRIIAHREETLGVDEDRPAPHGGRGRGRGGFGGPWGPGPWMGGPAGPDDWGEGPEEPEPPRGRGRGHHHDGRGFRAAMGYQGC